MLVSFEKWHGCHNDFIVIWSNPNEMQYLGDSLKRQAQRLCAKDGAGIGADGILVLETSSPREFVPKQLTIINRDGSLAANCGNGLRCAALSIYRHLTDKAVHELQPSVTLTVQGEEKICHFLPMTAKKTVLPWVAVTMGTCTLNEENPWHDDVAKELAILSKKLGQPGLSQNFYTAEIGNRHLAIFLDKISEELLSKVAQPLQQLWSGDGINVHLVQSSEPREEDQQLARLGGCAPLSEAHKALVWERGVGRTSACGSGACAIAVASLSNEFAERDQWVLVEMPGGSLYVQQKGRDYEAILAGSAEFVFAGTVEV